MVKSIESVGDRLKLFRTKMAKSQEDIATEMGWAQQLLARYEQGSKIPHTFLIAFYAKYPNDLIWLLTGKEPSPPPPPLATQNNPDTREADELRGRIKQLESMYYAMIDRFQPAKPTTPSIPEPKKIPVRDHSSGVV